MAALQSVGQQELGSTSATSSIPTGADRSAELRAQNNPIVKLYGGQIKQLKLGSVDFLDKLDVYQKAYSRTLKGTAAVSSLQISDLSSVGTPPPGAQEPTILKAARELLIAYGVAEKQNIKINELIKERAQAPSLVETVAHVMETESRGKKAASTGSREQTLNAMVIGPEAKDAALDSILSACTELSFKCQPAQK